MGPKEWDSGNCKNLLRFNAARWLGYAEEADPNLLIGLAEWVENRAEKHHAHNCFEAAEVVNSVANGLRILAEEAKAS
jgi:hypothetical protein